MCRVLAVNPWHAAPCRRHYLTYTQLHPRTQPVQMPLRSLGLQRITLILLTRAHQAHLPVVGCVYVCLFDYATFTSNSQVDGCNLLSVVVVVVVVVVTVIAAGTELNAQQRPRRRRRQMRDIVVQVVGEELACVYMYIYCIGVCVCT